MRYCTYSVRFSFTFFFLFRDCYKAKLNVCVFILPLSLFFPIDVDWVSAPFHRVPRYKQQQQQQGTDRSKQPITAQTAKRGRYPEGDSFILSLYILSEATATTFDGPLVPKWIFRLESNLEKENVCWVFPRNKFIILRKINIQQFVYFSVSFRLGHRGTVFANMTRALRRDTLSAFSREKITKKIIKKNKEIVSRLLSTSSQHSNNSKRRTSCWRSFSARPMGWQRALSQHYAQSAEWAPWLGNPHFLPNKLEAISHVLVLSAHHWAGPKHRTKRKKEKEIHGPYPAVIGVNFPMFHVYVCVCVHREETDYIHPARNVSHVHILYARLSLFLLYISPQSPVATSREKVTKAWQPSDRMNSIKTGVCREPLLLLYRRSQSHPKQKKKLSK